ncbi:glycosyltransferase [Collinsella sp. zg1085]|uniref:glycosyltransferase family 2 protein n=1 Tax=Collinsella sp. zg1085 TaxID=2844380 RepID=UPI001C0C868A|nr:glycosyltransferase [Collinsella sp. zg1085]QWT17568.1 glycosyltransferase [Collinsella sp. zg1085]
MAVTPQISILIPIYNVERYLEQCLDSILAQSYGDYEAICINDGSTDGSRAIVQRYLDADIRFRVIDKENSGYGASMNLGLAAARGEFVTILEADDFYEPDALAVLCDLAVREAADVAKGNFWFYWSEPAERRELFEFVDATMTGGLVHPQDYPQVFYRKPSIWSALYRRTFLERNRIRFLETPGASYQDAGFNFKVWACAERVICSQRPILSYRQDNEASSVRSSAKAFCVCDEYAEMQRFLIERFSPRADGRGARRGDNSYENLQGILERMKFDTYRWNYDRLSTELRPAFLSRFSREFADDMRLGRVDLARFEPWAEAMLRAVVEQPDAFAEAQRLSGDGGRMSALRRLLILGGPPLVCRVLFDKLKRA